MEYTTPRPQRKSPRSPQLDYSVGTYFVTICTQNHAHALGFIEHDTMYLSALGEEMEHAFTELPSHCHYAKAIQWVVMPNHVHALIRLNEEDAYTEGMQRAALSVVVGGLKRAVTVYAHTHGIPFAWQPRYHDHLIRSAADGNKIADYIDGNVINWALDRFYSE